MNILKKSDPNFQTNKKNRKTALKEYNVKTLKKILVEYNKRVRKQTYKGVSKMKRNIVEDKIATDFKMVNKKNNKAHQFVHRSGRYTEIFDKNK